MSSIWYASNTPADGIYSTPSDNVFLEFNRDLFLCNNITTNNDKYPQSANDVLCKDIQMDTICDSVTQDNFKDVKNCEICKNFKYRDWYDSNDPAAKYFSDGREEYLRAWLQSWNLGIGILLLLGGIYYQQS